VICIDVPTLFTSVLILALITYAVRVAVFIAVRRNEEEYRRSRLENSEAVEFVKLTKGRKNPRELYLGRREDGLYFLEEHREPEAGIPGRVLRMYVTRDELFGIRTFRYASTKLSRNELTGGSDKELEVS
jgi:hypothetical protein